MDTETVNFFKLLPYWRRIIGRDKIDSDIHARILNIGFTRNHYQFPALSAQWGGQMHTLLSGIHYSLLSVTRQLSPMECLFKRPMQI